MTQSHEQNTNSCAVSLLGYGLIRDVHDTDVGKNTAVLKLTVV